MTDIRKLYVGSVTVGAVVGGAGGILSLIAGGRALSVSGAVASLGIAAAAGALATGVVCVLVHLVLVRALNAADSRLAGIEETLISGPNAGPIVGSNAAGPFRSICERSVRLPSLFTGFVSDIRTAGEEMREEADRLALIVESGSKAAAELVQIVAQVSRNTEYQKADVDETREGFRAIGTSFASVAEQVDTQASLMDESAAAVEQMTRNVESVAALAGKAQTVSEKLATLAERSEEDLSNTAKVMQSIQEASEGIHELVSVISHIAARTNLLAVNAAIEAAHAGESGRGFAIVAEEVRRLAEESARSTKQITQNIGSIAELIRRGVEASEATTKALELIGGSIADNFDIISTISGSMDEQQVGAQQIVQSMHSLVEATDLIRSQVGKERELEGGMRAFIESLSESTRNNRAAVENHEAAEGGIEQFIRAVGEQAGRLKSASARLVSGLNVQSEGMGQ